MQTLAKFLNKAPPPGSVGIEIEAELTDIPSAVLPPNWIGKTDGSLRHGREYVTAKPMRRSSASIRKSLDALMAIINPFVIKGSISASTHIHLNALNMRPLHVANLATLWWLLEPYVLDDCGDERKSSRYARGFYWDNMLRKRFKSFNFHDDERYRALNLSSIHRHGSIEYRSMRASFDPEAITKWIGFLCRLQYDVAPSFVSPMHILDSFVQSRNKDAFINNIVGGLISTPLTDSHIFDLEERAIELYEFAWLPGPGSSWQAWEQALAPPVHNLDTGCAPLGTTLSTADMRIIEDNEED